MSIKRKFENWISEYHNPILFVLLLLISCLILPWENGTVIKVNSFYIMTDSVHSAPVTYIIQLIITYLVACLAFHFVDHVCFVDALVPIIVFFVVNWLPILIQGIICFVLFLWIVLIFVCHEYTDKDKSIQLVDNRQQLNLLFRKLSLLIQHHHLSLDFHGYLDENGLHVSKSQLIRLSNDLADQVDKYYDLAHAYHDKCMKK